MATLAERLIELEPQMASLLRVREERELLQALRSRLQQVSSAKGELERALKHFERIQRLGGSTTGRPRTSSQLRAKPEALSQQLDKQIDNIADNQQWDAGMLQPLTQFYKKLEVWTTETWQSLVDKRVEPVKDEVLDQFERLGFDSRVRAIRTARDRIRELRGDLPETDDALKVIIDQNDGIAKELGALDSIPAPVRVFIAKASKKEAELDDLTSEVRDWLRDNNMLKMIRIGFR
jgi:DNA repair exonuclease SbcCD ATPase subunit